MADRRHQLSVLTSLLRESKQAILAVFIISHALFLSGVYAQTTSVIAANEAAVHVNEWATVEGVVVKVFTSKSGNTFLKIGATYPNQTFTGWIPPASPVNKSPILSGIEGKHVRITWPNRNVQREAGNSDQCFLSD
jgi:hypothetical protein